MFEKQNFLECLYDESERQELLQLTDKELLVEILLELRLLNKNSEQIARNIVVFSD